MLREEQKALLADILTNATDTGKVSEILTTLAEDYMGVTASMDLLKAENDKLAADNASLLQQNMNLFLKVGTPIVKTGESVEDETPVEDLKFEDLFNAAGVLL